MLCVVTLHRKDIGHTCPCPLAEDVVVEWVSDTLLDDFEKDVTKVCESWAPKDFGAFSTRTTPLLFQGTWKSLDCVSWFSWQQVSQHGSFHSGARKLHCTPWSCWPHPFLGWRDAMRTLLHLWDQHCPFSNAVLPWLHCVPLVFICQNHNFPNYG